MPRSALGGFIIAPTAVAAAPVFFDGVANRINMLTAASDYTDATWTKSNITVGTGVLAPDGSTTAQKLQETTATNFHNFEQTITRNANQALPFRFSVFLQAAERTRAQIAIYDSGYANSVLCLIDLAGGVIVSAAAVGNFTLLDSSIKAFANGWYRVNLTANTNTNSTDKVQIVADAGSGNAALNNNYAGTTGFGINVWTSNLLPPAAWGMTTRPFFDDFVDTSHIDMANSTSAGFLLYRNNTWLSGPTGWNTAPPTPSANITASGSILTLSNDVSGFGEVLNSAVDDGAGGFRGSVYSLPFYMECSAAFDPNHAAGFHNPSSWPGFWTIAISALLTPTSDFMEDDVFEAIPSGIGTITLPTTIHQWVSGTDNRTGVDAFIGSPTFTAQHRYGNLLLSQASNGGSFGLKLAFFDGLYVPQSDVTWQAGGASNPSIDGTGALSSADSAQFPLILSCGPLSSGFSTLFDFVALYK